jgi:hypothetical protein
MEITPTKSVIEGWNGTVEGVKALAESLERNRKMEAYKEHGLFFESFMKREINPGDVFINSASKTYLPITVMAVCEGWLMLKKSKGSPFIYSVKNFNQIFIKDCGYKLKSKDFEYKGYLVVWDEGVFNIGDPMSCCALNARQAKNKIDEFYHPVNG